MKEHLISCIETNEVVSVYCDSDHPDTHLTGLIGYYSEEICIINHISKEGCYDGFIMIDPSEIFRIDYGGEYEKKIKTLYQHKSQSHPQLALGRCSFESFLIFCQKAGYIISVELQKRRYHPLSPYSDK